MLTGRFRAIFLAVSFHLLILVLISQTVVIHKQPIEVKNKAIKSFIYTPPPVVEKESIKEALATEIEIIEQDTPTPPNTVKKSEPATEVTAKAEQKEIEAESGNVDAAATPIRQPVTATFSPSTQLNKLRQSLTDKILEQEAYEYSRPKSASIMHGTPELVPHSVKRLTKKQKKEQATQRLSSGTKTIKGDDGLCFIERDLTEVGIEGVSATEAFTCGKSKFDKNFRDHMRKVREKLGK